MAKVRLQPLFHESMRRGIPVGVALTALIGCTLGFVFYNELSVAIMALLVAIPFLIAYNMMMVCRREPACLGFAQLWMSGIVQFICGGLITALVIMVYLMMHPGFLGDYFHRTLQMLAEMAAREGRPMPVEPAGLPAPSVTSFVGSIFWSLSFFGSVLSMLLGLTLPLLPAFRRLCMRSNQQN